MEHHAEEIKQYEGGKECSWANTVDVQAKVEDRAELVRITAASSTALSLSSYVAHCEELQPPALSVEYRLYTQ